MEGLVDNGEEFIALSLLERHRHKLAVWLFFFNYYFGLKIRTR